MLKVPGSTMREWHTPDSEDTKFGVTMGPEVGHGEAEVHARVQALGGSADQGAERIVCSRVEHVG
jgi:hypothetical protein